MASFFDLRCSVQVHAAENRIVYKISKTTGLKCGLRSIVTFRDGIL